MSRPRKEDPKPGTLYWREWIEQHRDHFNAYQRDYQKRTQAWKKQASQGTRQRESRRRLTGYYLRHPEEQP